MAAKMMRVLWPLDHLACLAKDYQANGCLHEYYEPDTGEGLTHPGFVNWNSASLFSLELESGDDYSIGKLAKQKWLNVSRQ